MYTVGGDDVDTLTLMFDKLQYIFRGYDQYIQTFTDACQYYRDGKLSEREYYGVMTDAVLKYSALEFLGLKAMFEIKKAVNRMCYPAARSPESGSAHREAAGSQAGQPNSLASFLSTKSLPARNELVQNVPEEGRKCGACGKILSNTAKFCTACGNKA